MENPDWLPVFTFAKEACKIVYLSLVTASISLVISRAYILGTVRTWIVARSGWFGRLINCTFCVSHWTAFVLVAYYRPALFTQAKNVQGFNYDWAIDILASAFAIITLSNIIAGKVYQAVAIMSQPTDA